MAQDLPPASHQLGPRACHGQASADLTATSTCRQLARPSPAQPVTDLTSPAGTSPTYRWMRPNRNNSDEKEYLAALQRIAQPGDESCDGCRSGSNAGWSPARITVSKLPLLANDMHLGILHPQHLVHRRLEAPATTPAGVTLPGAPFRRRRPQQLHRWGFTHTAPMSRTLCRAVNASDQASYTDPTGVTTWRPIEHRSEVIHVRGRKDVTLDVRVTTHGPILTPLAAA